MDWIHHFLFIATISAAPMTTSGGMTSHIHHGMLAEFGRLHAFSQANGKVYWVSVFFLRHERLRLKKRNTAFPKRSCQN